MTPGAGAVAHQSPRYLPIHLGMLKHVRDALIAHPDVDGVFCTNDDIAMGALPWCRERQLAVPEQISIAGFLRSGDGQANDTEPRQRNYPSF